MQIEYIVTNRKCNTHNQNRNWCKAKTKIGDIFIEAENEAITKISFKKFDTTSADCNKQVLKGAISQINEYLDGKRKVFDLAIKVYGSEFEIKVLKQLAEIPYGNTKTYGEIAKKISCKSAQAVGGACGRNPIPLVIPCHRIVGKNNALVGFNGGIEIKQKLLSIENNNKFL